MATQRDVNKKEKMAQFLDEMKEIDRTLYKDDFVRGFRVIVQAVQTLKTSVLNTLDETVQKADVAIDKMNKKNAESLDKMQVSLRNSTDKLDKRVSDGMNAVTDRMARMGTRIDSDLEAIAEELQEIRLSLVKEEPIEEENDEVEESLLLEEVEQLREEVESLKKRRVMGSAIMTGQNPGSIVELAATGTINGSNTDFVFAQKPKYIIVNGVQYREDKGWSWGANNTATLDFAPATNSDVYGIF